MLQRVKANPLKAYVFLFISGLAGTVCADTGKVIPGEFGIMIFALVFLGAFAAAGLITLFTVMLLKLLKRRQPKTYAWMVVGTAFLPLLYIWLEDAQNLLYDFEGTYGYARKEQLHYILIVLVAILGQVLGYWVTPKRAN